MNILAGLRLSQIEVLVLLNHFDDSSDIPLHVGLNFEAYSRKLSNYARFVIAEDEGEQIGFIAYYLNIEGGFVYIPQIVVHKAGRHKGVGHAMLEALYNSLKDNYILIRLEVLKANGNARTFYSREGFLLIEAHNDRLLLEKSL